MPQGPGKPIRVTNPNDPRLRKYLDSMSLFKASDDARKVMYSKGMTGPKWFKYADEWNANHPEVDKALDELHRLTGVKNKATSFVSKTMPATMSDNGLERTTIDAGTDLFAKPVQPYELAPEPQKSKTGSLQPFNKSINIPTTPLSSNVSAGRPTAFSFTGTQGGQQVTRYFDDLDTWQAATDQMGYRHRETTNEGKEAHATGYEFKNGGTMQNLLFRRYQQPFKRAAGGTIPYSQIAQMGSGLIDAFDKPDDLGFQSNGATIGKSALSGAGTGAAIGSVVPGIGTAIGAGVGALAGATVGFIKGRQNNAAERNMRNAMAFRTAQQANNYSAAQLASDPTLAAGTQEQSYFSNGGSMRKYVKAAMGGTIPRSPMTDAITSGGSAQPLSSDNALIKGNSHADGGVKMAGINTEVEGGETTLDNYVFSKKLGFADIHKKIAVSKGKIEKKPRTLERANSLRRLMAREQDLAQQQEQVKAINGLQ